MSACVVCLGDPRLELIQAGPGGFEPHLGGPAATLAAAAARAGAPVVLAGRTADDGWGRWLRMRLLDAGVGLEWLAAVPDARTPLALTTLDSDGRPSVAPYGDAPGEPVGLDDALQGASALCLSAETLVGDAEREHTMRTRSLALEAGLPVVFDAALRMGGWRSQADAAASSNACVPGALLVRASRSAATVMTGEDDPERAALALLKAGARLVVISLGAEGAILRGELRADADADADGTAVPVRSTAGAGQVLAGTLLARLAASAFYPAAAAAGLGEAVRAAARACERWGALD